MGTAVLRRVALSVVLGLVAGLLAAVVLDRRQGGDGDDARPSSATLGSEDTDGADHTDGDCPPGTPSRADVDYVTAMRAHHQQAVEMAAILRDRPGAPYRVVNFADQVGRVQSSEIGDMDAWLAAWDDALAGTDCLEPDAGAAGHEGMDMSEDGADVSPAGDHGPAHHRMPGMLTRAQLDDLGQRSGTDAARRYVTLMIEHHLGAVSMSRPVARDGGNAWAVSLAKHVVASQASEIGAMRRMRAGT